MRVKDRVTRQATSGLVRSLPNVVALCVVLGLGVACDGDGSLSPARSAPLPSDVRASGAPTPDECSVDCTLFTGVGPLRLAVTRADSASHLVPVSIVRVRGASGDSVTLHFDAEDNVLAAAGPKAGVRVSIRDENYVVRSSIEFSLTTLRAGAAVARFTATEEITIDVALLRTVHTRPPAGRSLLVQRHWGTAEVASADRYFITPSAGSLGGPRIAVIEDPGGTPGSFQVPGSGTYGDVDVAIAPEWNNGPGEVFSGAFQSDSGTGASRDITITFSKPVAFVSITVLDPTWEGNRLITYGPDGEELANAEILGSGVPGVNHPKFRTFAGNISRMVLVAAPNDYVAYQLQITLAAAELILECLPAQVERGELVRCEASVTPPELSNDLQLTEWTFMPDDADVTANPPLELIRRESDVSSTVWQGIVAVSGTVRVRGTLAGAAVDKTAAISVAARTWSNKTIEVQVTETSPGDLPQRPTGFSGQFGKNVPGDPLNLAQIGLISDGPNTGISYFKDVPVTLQFTVTMNTTAMAEGSDFWKIQEPVTRTVAGKTYCGRSVVSRTLPALVRQHEGMSRSDRDSHTQVYADRFEREFQRDAGQVERMVGRDDVAGFGSFLARWSQAADQDSRSIADTTRNVINSRTLPCEFRYTYPGDKK